MHSLKYIIIFISIFALISCSENKMKTAFINGKIYTVNKEQPIAQAVLIENNKIVFVGSNEEAKKFIGASTKVIDLNSKLMLPGFIDSHLHMISGGFYTLEVDLRPAKSRAEFTSILKEYVKKNPGEWVTQGRWDNEKWDDKSLPTKDWIDDFSQTTPILVKRIDGHLALANSYALKLAGITKDTPSPEGGIIVKDPVTGDPNGLLKDLALELFDTVISEPPEDDYINAALAALNEFKAFGITSVQDITFNFAGDENKPLYDLQTYKQLEKNHQLTCRIQARIPIDYYKDLLDKNILHNSGTNYVKLGSIKAYGDGALGSRSAWFFEPYADDSSNYGLVYDIISNGSLKRWALDADKNKLQISIHAIGDRTNNYVLNLYEEIKNENPEWDRRFRIEHAQHLIPGDVKRFKEINVIASVQPYHAIDDGVWVRNRIGKEREMLTHMYRSYLNNNVVIAFGTDWPVAPLNPLYGIYAAVTRRTVDGKNPGGWLPEQKITIEEAIKAYTLDAAYASYEENIKGSIEVGKLADMVVLSDDILMIDPVMIWDVKVEITIFDGKIIYKR
ncbi:MAG: amidohydrolase [Bacteroidetes bacterium]|nr:amidohydrolase [Bacteroidota bacterium]